MYPLGDTRIRIKFARLELSRKLLRFFQNNKLHKFDISYLEFPYFLPSISKTRHFCLYTGRARNIIRIFKVSRFFLREEGLLGNLLGLRKASW